MSNSLFAFIDLKDPFTFGEIADEPLPGPVLSILASRTFTDLFLFHTPQTRENAEATVREIKDRYPDCRVDLFSLAISDPKDYSAIMGALGRQVRTILGRCPDADHSVCVSSGTAEMRAAWFLLRAANVLPARLLQVGSPIEPLFGAAGVKEVSLVGDDWSVLRDLVMPLDYFAGASAAPAARGRTTTLSVPYASFQPPDESLCASEPEPAPESHPQLEAALRELNFHVHSPKTRLLVERAAIVASYDEATLISGETGTGKELVAKLVHRLSPRRHKKMVTVNCGAIPQALAESLLFGHVKGAFTGAVMDRDGVFQAADGGTLFLDEIGELSPACQVKILRTVQFGECERVGSTVSARVDVRVIAATNRNLHAEISKGNFREDLYHRLNVLALEAPSLRERPGEIVPLALALLKDINARREKPRQLSKEGLRRLESHHWPGNVRELEAVLKRSAIFATRPVLGPEDILIDAEAAQDPFSSLPEPGLDFKLEDFLDKLRTHLILRALGKANGSKAGAAALLGISRQAVSQFLARNRG